MNQRILSNNEAVIGGSLRGMSDESLVVAAQDRNINAFAELRDHRFRTLLRTTYRIIRNWDAANLLQEPFLMNHQGRNQLAIHVFLQNKHKSRPVLLSTRHFAEPKACP